MLLSVAKKAKGVPSSFSPRTILGGAVTICVLLLLWASLKQSEKVSSSLGPRRPYPDHDATLRAANGRSDPAELETQINDLKHTVTTLEAELAFKSKAAADAAPRKHVIVGLAKGIEAELLYRFARSARNHMPAEMVDIVLFLHKDDAPAGSDLELVMKQYQVQVASFDTSTFSEPKHRNYHPSSYRWMLIRDWMATNAANKYGGVFFTDVRDAVFQSNLFAHMHDEGDDGLEESFYAFQEARPRTIAECGWNSGWVSDCFGQEGLNKVGREIISCSGTSLATWRSAVVYAKMMGDEMATNKCERNGADQGVHNYFVYSGKLDEALQEIGSKMVLVDNENGFVGTVQSMNSLKMDKFGRLVNDKREPYAVVHQYDRSDLLKEQLARENTWLPQAFSEVPK
jgi:hypothetical protein